jgi:hypothetical protein
MAASRVLQQVKMSRTALGTVLARLFDLNVVPHCVDQAALGPVFIE